MTAPQQENHTKMRFNGPSTERHSKDNLWPSALTPPILPGPLFVTSHLSNPVRWSDYSPFWKQRLHASRIRTSFFQQLYMTTNHWIVEGIEKGTRLRCVQCPESRPNLSQKPELYVSDNWFREKILPKNGSWENNYLRISNYFENYSMLLLSWVGNSFRNQNKH